MVKDSDKVELDILAYELWSITEAEAEINAVVAALEDLHNTLKEIEDERND